MPTKDVLPTSPAPAKPNGSSLTTFPIDPSDDDEWVAGAIPAKQRHSQVSEGSPIPLGSLFNQPSTPLSQNAQGDSQKGASDDRQSEDDLSNEHLALLVQRYTVLCQARQTLQDEIENRLKKRERLAMEKLICAKIRLEEVRKQAVEAVAELNKASGGDTRICLSAGAPDGAYLSPPFVPDGAPGPGSLPPTVSTSASPAAGSTNLFTPSGNPVSESNAATPPVCPFSGTSVDQLKDLISRLRRPTAPPPPPPQAPPPPLQQLDPPSGGVIATETQQAIFNLYDEKMKAAKAAGAAVQMPWIPWPIFVSDAHQYRRQEVMEKHLVNSEVADFFRLYLRCKDSDFHDGRRTLRADWDKLLLAVPGHKRGGKACVRKVVSILHELAPGNGP
jgi:hypothetical protein